MNYYSTNNQAPIADLHKAVVKGLAEDCGLYMPERINKLPQEFFDNIEKMSFQEIAYTVASAFFGEDVDPDALHDIVYDTLQFDCPVVNVKRRTLYGATAAVLHSRGRSKDEGERRGERAGGYQW